MRVRAFFLVVSCLAWCSARAFPFLLGGARTAAYKRGGGCGRGMKEVFFVDRNAVITVVGDGIIFWTIRDFQLVWWRGKLSCTYEVLFPMCFFLSWVYQCGQAIGVCLFTLAGYPV